MVGKAGGPGAMTWQGVIAVLLVFIVCVAARKVIGGSALLWTAISLPAIWFASRIGARKARNV
jgi:hypothetical protein